jgi:hypothetical protein
MDFFEDCSTVAEIKTTFRTLAMMYHPDKMGGDETIFKDLNNAYQKALKDSTGQKTKRGEKEYSYTWDEVAEVAIAEMIANLIALNMEGVEISLIGSWVWVAGETKPYKEKLGKDGLGLSWHFQRKCWYFTVSERRSYSSKGLNELAEEYGVQHFKAKSVKRLGKKRNQGSAKHA